MILGKFFVPNMHDFYIILSVFSLLFITWYVAYRHSPQPHRAKLVQIPDSIDPNNHPDTDLKRPILSTSQFKFPRKTNGTSTVPLSSYTTNNKFTNATSNNINNIEPTSHNVPIQITETFSPNHEIPLSYTKKSDQSDNLKHACLAKNFFLYYLSLDYRRSTIVLFLHCYLNVFYLEFGLYSDINAWHYRMV